MDSVYSRSSTSATISSDPPIEEKPISEMNSEEKDAYYKRVLRDCEETRKKAD
jgi:hypothetical protein